MRRALKVVAWSLGGLIALIIVVGSALYIAANSDSGRARIENMTARLTGGHVKLTGLGGRLPRVLTLDQLQLSDSRGVWLTADRVTLRWTPLALFSRRLQVDSLQAAKVIMERIPESSAPATTSPPSIPHIDAASVSIDELDLGPQLSVVPAPLVLRGAAHLRTLTDMVIEVNAHRVGGIGDYVLHLQFDSKRMDAMLKLNEPAGGPLENLLQLPGLGALAATLNLSGPRSAERLELSIDAGTLHGSARGNINVNDLSGDLNFDFQAAAMSPRPDVSWDGVAVQGRWHGNLKTPTADGHIEVTKLQLPGGIQLAALRADATAGGGRAALKALVEGLQIPGPQPRLFAASPLNVDATIQLNDPARPLDISATHRLFSLVAHAGLQAQHDEKRSATVEIRLPDLAPWAALGGQNVRGSALIKAQLQNGGAATGFVIDADAAISGGTESWSTVVGNRATLHSSGVLADQGLALEALNFSGNAVTLMASGSVSQRAAGRRSPNPWTVRLPWSLAVSNLAALSPTLAGTLKASGLLEGPATALAATVQLTSDVSVAGTQTGVITADAKLRGLPSAPTGTVSAHGSLDGAPLDIDLDMQRDPAGVLRALIRRADWKSAHVEGDMTVPPAIAQTRGQLRAKIDQLSDLRDFLGSDIAGSLAGSIEVHADGGRSRAQLKFDARDLAVRGFVGSASATGDGFVDALKLKVSLEVPDLGGTAASLSADGTLNLDARELTLAGAVAKYRGQDVQLLAPARFALANGVAVDALKLGAQHAVFQLQGRLSPTLDLHASLRQLEAPLVDVFVPGLMSGGVIEAEAQLQGSAASPTGQIEVTASGIQFATDDSLDLPQLDARATAKLRGDTADIDARLSAGSASQLTVAGRVPLAIEGTRDLTVKGNLDVGLLNSLLERSGQHVAGQLAIDAHLAGNRTTPQIDGTVKLTEGSFTDYRRGVNVTNIGADIVGEHGVLQIKSMTASAPPGTLSMTGTIGVLQPGWPVDLHVTAKNAQPLASKLITTNFNADMRVSGTAKTRLDVAGTVHLNRTVIGVASSLPPNVAVLDVRRKGKAAPAAPGKRLVVGLDVTLQAPREILLQGRNLDAELGGEVHITGTADAPVVTGGFDLQRGSFLLASSRLNFTPPGRVSFDGAGLKNKIDPTLDFTAQTTAGDATSYLRITGYADAPKFEFSSNPPLPQDEIMARLLFGENTAQLTPLQIAQIGAALATISGVGGDGSLNPLTKVQRSLGLDRLTVGATTGTSANGTENTGATIEAGRYVSKRVYVEARQTTLGTSQLETDVDLSKHLKLQVRLGNGTASAQGTTPENDPGSSLGLSYQFEY
ncbi:MAG TPA: translocation/assembly module TamB domain-containing protein [Steroidobacteraceae bacterium]|nr:translocation/assembly module TamB domain-containing protein [Steroidobacteraceae bacterium]